MSANTTRDPSTPRNYPRRIAARATAALPQTRAVARPFRVLDLFSGIGGFSLGLERAGMQTVAFCEIEPYCQAVLKKHWPDVPIHDDIRTLTVPRGTADVVCGGFPCQPFSSASRGRLNGRDDDRYLWPEMLRVVRECQPSWVIGENVAHLRGVDFDAVVTDLEREGYEVQALEIPACATSVPGMSDK